MTPAGHPRHFDAATMPDLPVLDSAAIATLRGLDPAGGDAFLREIIGLFLEDTPQQFATLAGSLAGADAPRFIRAAHSIKGSAANLGALRLRACAEQLEHAASAQGLGAAADLLPSIQAAFAQTRAELQQLLPPA